MGKKEGKRWEDLATVKESKTKKKIGLKAEPCHNQRQAEKMQVEPAIPVHEKRMVERSSGSLPVYPMDREGAKVLSDMINYKQTETVGNWEIPLPKVQGQGETEILEVT